MVQILIIEKSGSIKELNAKETSEEYLCKKAGFKNNKGFEKRTTWNIDNICDIVMYAKTEGRAGQENKYDFPPPVDQTLYFGPCVLMCIKNKKEVDLDEKTWKLIYEKLFGGFEDIGDEDSEEEDDDEDEDIPKTKEGYAKDGFVVGDDAEDADDEDEDEDDDDDDDEDDDDDVVDELIDDDDDDDDELDEDEEEEVPKRVQPKRKVKSKDSKLNTIFTKVEEDDYLNCESELEEEDYL